ncbi:hypothetical protein DENSPDRAFT_851970 [Dentipellis sp. KUC8613]|nr:hypothetical protein DENSPDRAFT_851970 [Dentipellis sp. KUC8613]
MGALLSEVCVTVATFEDIVFCDRGAGVRQSSESESSRVVRVRVVRAGGARATGGTEENDGAEGTDPTGWLIDSVVTVICGTITVSAIGEVSGKDTGEDTGPSRRKGESAGDCKAEERSEMAELGSEDSGERDDNGEMSGEDSGSAPAVRERVRGRVGGGGLTERPRMLRRDDRVTTRERNGSGTAVRL